MSLSSDYAIAVNALLQEKKASEQALPLISQGAASLFYLRSQPTPKVMLFFHGFTSLPIQFESMSKTFYRMGYNVLVPLLPGHGQAGMWNAKNPSPLPSDRKIYQDFALKWFDRARALGDKVVVGGLSGGGTLAAWLAMERSHQIHRALLFAPFLSSSSQLMDLIAGLVGSYYEWDLKPGEKPLGYSGFRTEALRVFLQMGDEILDRASANQFAPMFVISSESDRSVNNMDHETLFNRAVQLQPKCWRQNFNRVLSIPHTMMRAEDGNNYAYLLVTLAKAFVESDLTWAEVKQIAYYMTQGRTFYSVVDHLRLSSKVSPDMAAMITMVDKRQIIEEHKGNRRR